MKIAERVCLTFFLLIIATLHSYATWSIIIIDPTTKEIGIAGASCTYSVYGIGAIVPAKGAIVVQAMSNPFARTVGYRMIMADASPEEILKALNDPMFDPDEQQYAVICVTYLDKPLTFTGNATLSFKGALTAKGLSVQGNTLTDSTALQAVLEAAIKAQQDSMPIAEVLMLALEAGAKLGGDKRCGDTKASSAFLTVAKPGDNPKTPYLNLIVYGTDENANAVEILRRKFNNWKTEPGNE